MVPTAMGAVLRASRGVTSPVCDLRKCTGQVPCGRLGTVYSPTGNSEVLVEFMAELGNIPPIAPALTEEAREQWNQG